MFEFKPTGVCSRKIEIELDEIDGRKIVKSVQFYGGCIGNAKGVSRLVEGMYVDDVIRRLEGTTCGFKNTSCPDQLAQALKQCSQQ